MHNEIIQLYDDRGYITLTTYIHQDSPELLAGQRKPAILICPGGGYLNCSDREAEPVALRFAAMGYHTFVLRYSTYYQGRKGLADPKEVKDANPETMYPAPMLDIGKAFLTIQSRADEWLVDTDRIAICGFSAGAHNCAMYSTYWNDPVIYEHFGEKPEKFKPAAAILGYGLYNYHVMLDPNYDWKDPFAPVLRQAATVAYFGTKDPSQEMLKKCSPVYNIGSEMPPCFLWATTEDTLVPVVNSCEMSEALAKADIPFEVHIYEKGPHGLSLADQSSAGNKFELNDAASGWITAAEKWLGHRFALPLKDRPFWMDMIEKQEQE